MRKLVLGLVLLAGSQAGCRHPGTHGQSNVPSQRVQPGPQTDPSGNTYPRADAEPPRPQETRMPTWFPKGRPINRRWTYVVIHHSATDVGGARAFDQHHRSKGWDELGYHFVIGNGTQTPDGMIEVGPRWEKQKHGAHCKTPDNYFNEHGIGICLVGDFCDSRPTRKQLNSLYYLVRFLSQTCSIAPERITTHGAITHKTVCPGPNFPIRPLRDAVRSSNRMASAQ